MMKPIDYSHFEKKQRSEYWSDATFEVPANRKARRDVIRKNGGFKKSIKRVKRDDMR